MISDIADLGSPQLVAIALRLIEEATEHAYQLGQNATVLRAISATLKGKDLEVVINALRTKVKEPACGQTSNRGAEKRVKQKVRGRPQPSVSTDGMEGKAAGSQGPAEELCAGSPEGGKPSTEQKEPT